MTPADVARADQIRATLREALTNPCTCGDCPTDGQLRFMLTFSDADLLQLVDG